MRIRLMGAIRVEDDLGKSQRVTSPRIRLLLGLLATNSGTVISTDRLINLLWPDGAPDTAEVSLQIAVSKLRTLLEPNRPARSLGKYVRTSQRGYQLELAEGELDIAQFAEAAEAAMKPGADPLTLSDALAVWTDHPLAELSDLPWAMEVIERLEEQHVQLLSRQCSLAIDTGKAESVLATLAQLQTTRPYDERLAALRMRALFVAGRQADSLAVFEATRQRLLDDLGLDPTSELRAMELAVLEQNPELTQQHSDRATHRGAGPLHNDTLYGRSEQIEDISNLLKRSALVTLIGPAGSGKTRLASAVIAATDRRRTYFVDLALVDSDDRVARVAANQIGIVEEPNVSTARAIQATLGREPTLVVLDNCEHVLDGAAVLSGALVATPGVVVLATSQQQLGITDETLVRVEPLDPPAPHASLAEIVASPAVQMLADRAGIELTVDNADEIAKVCRRLDGLPLALELAAHRLGSIGAADLLRHLEVRGTLDAPISSEHHRSLDSALERSTVGLTSSATSVLVALSVCASAVPLALLERLVDSDHSEHVQDAVVDLVERNLIYRFVRGSSNRYGVLETLRSYCLRGLSDDEVTDWRSRHVRAIAEIAQVRQQKDKSIQLTVIADEFSAALDWLEHTASDGPLHMQLATSSGTLWYQVGRLTEGRARMQKALDLYPNIEPLWRGITLAAAGLVSFSEGAFADQERLLSEAIEVLGELGLPGIELLVAARFVGLQDLDSAEEHIARALESSQVTGPNRAMALDIGANLAWLRGDYGAAIVRFEQGERAADSFGDVYLKARAIRGRALMHVYMSSKESAALLCQRSIDMITDWTNDRGVAQSLAIRAAVSMEFGKVEDARQDALATLRRASTRFDFTPVMIAIPILTNAETIGRRFDSVAMIAGWTRGICDSTGMYLPVDAEKQLQQAEAQAEAELDPLTWSDMRRQGASNGLVGLIAHLEPERTASLRAVSSL